MVICSWKQVSTDLDKNCIYESLLGFCTTNMNSENKWNQVCGSLSLSRLIENCPLVLSSSNMKNIWEQMCIFLEKFTFNAKSEMLDALISLVFAAESFFKPFATVTLYKILDYLTDSDWVKRKLAVDIVYTLANYCQEEIFTLKSHIIEFLKVLKSDKIKQVREACLVTLKFLNDHENLTETTIKNDNNKSINLKTDKSEDLNKNKELRSIESVCKSSINQNSSGVSLQDKNQKNIKVSKNYKPTRNTEISNPSTNLSTCSNKNPFNTNELKGKEKGMKINSDRKGKRDKTKTPEKKEKMNLSVDMPHDKTIKENKSIYLKNNTEVSESTSILPPKEDKNVNRNSSSIIKISKKRETTESPMKKKEVTVSSIFKGPKNSDFFNNAPKENGIIFYFTIRYSNCRC